MTKAAILERLIDLPRELAADVRIAYVEATSPELQAACMAYRASRDATLKTYRDWAEAKGAYSFFIPDGIGISEERPQRFLFKEAPDKRAWKQVKVTRWDRIEGGGLPYVPTKFPEGKAIQAEIAALPAFPSKRIVLQLLNAPDSVCYQYDGGRGSCTVGGSSGTIFFETFGYVGDRNYIVFPNPFFTVSEMASSDSYEGLEIEGDLLDWRPPEGWTLTTKAKFDLVVAQYRVAQAEKAA